MKVCVGRLHSVHRYNVAKVVVLVYLEEEVCGGLRVNAYGCPTQRVNGARSLTKHLHRNWILNNRYYESSALYHPSRTIPL